MQPQPPEFRTPATGPTRGRHRRIGSAPAEKFLLDVPGPERPTSLADAPPAAQVYRATRLPAGGRAATVSRIAPRQVPRQRPAPLPGVRDAVASQLPKARRAAGNVRDWALAGTGSTPVIGTHRAPGTLPLESWLLIGRHRQQALLGALVAIGLTLVLLPTTRPPADAGTVNAADNQITTVGQQGHTGRQKPGTRPGSAGAGRQQAPPAGSAAPGSTGPQPVPSRSDPVLTPPDGAPSASASPDPDSTASGVSPDARGPARSLRTTGTEAIALTFDDGPDPVTTPKILKLLADYQLKATFCLVGERAKAHPELVQQIVAGGNTLCNHSWDHDFKLGSYSAAAIRKDLEDTNNAIRAAVPDATIPYFRAPGGIFTNRLVAAATEHDMASLYWAVDPRDWDHGDDKDDAAHIARVIAEVKKHVKPGSIVLSHDFNQPDTILAYEQLLPYLTEKYTIGLPPQ